MRRTDQREQPKALVKKKIRNKRVILTPCNENQKGGLSVLVYLDKNLIHYK